MGVSSNARGADKITMPFPARLRPPTALAALLCALAVTATPDGHVLQDGLVSRRQVMTDRGLAAIDRGFRPRDYARAPRSARHLSRAAEAAAARTEPYVRGSVLVKFAEGMTVSATTAALSGTGASPLARPPHADFDIVTIPQEADPEAVAEALGARPDVVWAQPRYRVHAMLTPNDPLYPFQWNFPALDMEGA